MPVLLFREAEILQIEIENMKVIVIEKYYASVTKRILRKVNYPIKLTFI